MKPLTHALLSVKKYGGKVEDYLPVHDFFDSSKATFADPRHRAILHSTFGIFLVERIFGQYVTNSEGRMVATRDLGEEHVFQDLGQIPTVERWLRNMTIEQWMSGPVRKGNKPGKKIMKVD